MPLTFNSFVCLTHVHAQFYFIWCVLLWYSNQVRNPGRRPINFFYNLHFLFAISLIPSQIYPFYASRTLWYRNNIFINIEFYLFVIQFFETLRYTLIFMTQFLVFVFRYRTNKWYNLQLNNSSTSYYFVCISHYENMPIQTYWKNYHQKKKKKKKKNENFQIKILRFFIFLLKT